MISRTLADLMASGRFSPGNYSPDTGTMRPDPTTMGGHTMADPRTINSQAGGQAAAVAMAEKLGVQLPGYYGRQGLPASAGNTNVASPAAPRNAPIGVNTSVNSQGVPEQQPMPGQSPNAQQMSPQAQAMSDALRKRMAMSAVQKMAADRGVFSGQQQGAVLPGMPAGALPPLYGGK